VPQNKDWFAYKASEPESQRIIAESLQQTHKVRFEPGDIHMTTGAFGALTVALETIVNPGDEVIFMTPLWFFYEAMILAAGGVPIRVPVQKGDFDLNVAAIEAAITDRTIAIIVNTPHNPTGKIYPAATLERLADVLTRASDRHGRDIYLLSDESYNRIVYDGNRFPSPVAYYPNTFLIYTYGKTLLAPGQRMGYLALPETMPGREALRGAIPAIQYATGFAFPNALLQHALADLDKLSIDIEHLQYRRDWMVNALRDMGYEITVPEGAFYLLPRSPIHDDWAFCETLARDHNILVLPGTVIEIPGYFRISLTANDSMIENALPQFEAAIAGARKMAANPGS
jgi:aspartate aminotransferase